MSILIDKLKDPNYYKNKLPLSLKNSYGMQEQVDAFARFMNGPAETTQVESMEGLNIGENLGNEYLYVGPTNEKFTFGHVYKVVENTYYQVTYNLNGGEGSVPVDSTLYSIGDIASIDFSILPTPVGQKDFLGWSTDSTATTPEFTEDGLTTIEINGDVNLYAIYREYYLVSYSANDGEGSVPIDNTKYYYGDIVTVDFSVLPYKSGQYDFVGWDVTSSSTDPLYTIDGIHTFTITENVSLYAIYKEYYLVTYNINNGSGTVPVDSNHYHQGDIITLLYTSLIAPQEGYQFAGWSFNDNNDIADYTFDVEGDPIYINSNLTFYAIYCLSFSASSWLQIKEVIDSEKAKYHGWRYNDRKTFTLTYNNVEYEYQAIIADLTLHRYELSDGSGYSNAVIEFNYCMPRQLNTYMYTSSNQGGWAQCRVRSLLNNTTGDYYLSLPDDMRQVISTVKVLSANGYGGSITSSDNLLFIPAQREITYSSTSSAGISECPKGIFERYKEDTSSIRSKQPPSSSGNWYWLRSPRIGDYSTAHSYYRAVNNNGVVSDHIVSSTDSINVIFAI